METPQKNLLSIVSKTLLNRGEEFEWITMPDSKAEKIGLAYVPCELDVPCSFMFTEVKAPASLVLDALFASRVHPEDYFEVGIMLQTLNANQTEGVFVLDVEAGYVYFRQTLSAEGIDLTDEQILRAVMQMEETATRMTRTFARIMSEEFPV